MLSLIFQSTFLSFHPLSESKEISVVLNSRTDFLFPLFLLVNDTSKERLTVLRYPQTTYSLQCLVTSENFLVRQMSLSSYLNQQSFLFDNDWQNYTPTLRREPSTLQNKQKSCYLSLISYLKVPPLSQIMLQEIRDHKWGNKRELKKSLKCSRTCNVLPFIEVCWHSGPILSQLFVYISEKIATEL